MIGSLAITVLTMMFSFDSISQTTWITCPLQVNDPVQIFIMFLLRELTPLASRRYSGIAPPLMNSCWCDTSHRFCQSTGSGLSLTKNTEYLFARHPFSRCRRYSMASSKTSRHDVSWSSSTLYFSKYQWIHDEKYHPCPSMICVMIDNRCWLLDDTKLVMYVLICFP